mmetsp:Transcript_47960/g.84425  ORF Transcript_47960/g.84425 Transcript_47960/m.84425 type:complete len:173 (-) Transcript_47960:223-741(-)
MALAKCANPCCDTKDESKFEDLVAVQVPDEFAPDDLEPEEAKGDLEGPFQSPDLMVQFDATSEGIGIDVDWGDGSLRIIKVKELRLMAKWNETNPEKRVEVGDIIAEVNSVRGAPQTLLDEYLRVIKSCGVLTLGIQKAGKEGNGIQKEGNGIHKESNGFHKEGNGNKEPLA